MERLAMWIAWRLPRRIVMWAVVRAAADVSMTPLFADRELDSITPTEIVRAWGGDRA